MKRILLLTTVLTLLVVPVFAQKTRTLTNADKAQVIRSILEDRRFDQRSALPDEERLNVYLSTENIARNLVPPKIGNAAILLKSPQEIEKEKNSLTSYCAFGKFEFKNSTVIVSFYNYWKNSAGDGFDRGVLEYEYRKVAGKWKFISRKHPGLRIGS